MGLSEPIKAGVIDLRCRLRPQVPDASVAAKAVKRKATRPAN